MPNKKIKCLFIIGTRPEALKLVVLIQKLKQEKWAEVVVLVTAQHRELLDQVLAIYNITPDFDLNIMQDNQDLVSLTSKLFAELSKKIDEIKPNLILSQGDTTTVMVSSLLAFYKKIKFAHVEAGLRSNDLHHPFPEELNRVITGITANFHFAPTEKDKENLVKSNVPEKKIFVIGNTIIDNLLEISQRKISLKLDIPRNKKIILVTLHRRESFGIPLDNICRAIADTADQFPESCFVYPIHPNPNVRATVNLILANKKNVVLCEPLDYEQFVALMCKSYLILTDSGGIQEEAPVLGKPVLVARKTTERTDTIELGTSKLVGTDYKQVKAGLEDLLTNKSCYSRMSKICSPYGDGKSSERIVKILYKYFNDKTSITRKD